MKGRNNLAVAAALLALLILVAVFVFLRPGLSPDRTAEQAPAPTPPAAEERQAEQPSPSGDKTASPPATDQAEDTSGPTEEKIPSAEDKAAAGAPSDEKSADETPSAADKAEDAGPEDEKAADMPATAEEKSAEANAPSFDVVRIEPTGDGVIAGRAEPGWTISVESGGDQVAMAEADEHGEWTVILDRPLAPGSHTLSLQATSPDGKERSSSTQTVSAEVATPPTKRVVAGTPQPAPAGGGTASTVKPAPASVPPAPKPPVPEAVQAKRDVTPGRVTRGEASPLPQTASVEEEKAEGPSALAPQDRPGTYTILKGDTLWDIAQRYLGAGWRYKTIYKDNRKIIRNPNLIYPEQRMTIAEPSGDQN